MMQSMAGIYGIMLLLATAVWFVVFPMGAYHAIVSKK